MVRTIAPSPFLVPVDMAGTSEPLSMSCLSVVPLPKEAGGGSEVDIATSDSIGPRKPERLATWKKGSDNPMPRPALVSLSLLEGIEAYDHLLTRAASDGVIDVDEMRQLARAFRPLRRKCARLHDSLSFVDMAIHGNGIDGEWFGRRVKEDMKARLYLVQPEDEGPEPSGPAAAQREAA